MAVCGFVSVNSVTEAKRGLWISLEVELEVCVSCLMWMRQTDLRPSGNSIVKHVVSSASLLPFSVL